MLMSVMLFWPYIVYIPYDTYLTARLAGLRVETHTTGRGNYGTFIAPETTRTSQTVKLPLGWLTYGSKSRQTALMHLWYRVLTLSKIGTRTGELFSHLPIVMPLPSTP